MYTRITLIVFLAFAAGDSYAQFWKKKKNRKANTEQKASQPQPTSRDPFGWEEKKRMYAPPEASASRRSSKGPTYGLEEQFYERMEQVAKTRRKMQRLMEKPQYSDPSYFGHKRKPKKRKPSKMRFCDECGIRH